MMGDSLLRTIPFFRNLSDEDISALTELCELKSYSKNSIVFSQHEKGDTLYLILKGSVKVTLLSESGREVILSILKNGDFFGEMAILDGLPRSASVITMENTEFMCLKRERFLHLLSKKPEIGVSILAEMSKRLREADERIESLSLLDVYGRTARWIIKLAKKEGKKTENGILIEKIPKQIDIAGIVGTTRESISRVLTYFQRSGLITIKGSSMIVHDAELASAFSTRRKQV